MRYPISRREFLRCSSLILSGGALGACNSFFESKEEPGLPVDGIKPTSTTLHPRNLDSLESPEVIILAKGLEFPEGPAFDPLGRLWCTEMDKGNLVLFSEGNIDRIPTNGRPNGLVFDQYGRAWICDSSLNAIRRYDPADQSWKLVMDNVEGNPLQTPNDLAFDSVGNLIFTCPDFSSDKPNGYVVCLSPNGKSRVIARNMHWPNGLDFLDNGSTLVVADTYEKTLVKGAWDANSCRWIEPQPWVVVGGATGPDGMVPTEDGKLYCAVFGDGVIRVLDAKGNSINDYSLPGKNPTNVTFDPSGTLGMIVTEAEKGLLLSLPEIQENPIVFNGGDTWN